MKKLKLILLCAVALMGTSCIVDDEDPAQGLIDAPTIVDFTKSEENLILTPSIIGAVEYSTNVNIITEIPNNGDLSFKYSVNTAETTLSDDSYEILTSAGTVFSIANGQEVANNKFEYLINPSSVPVGETLYLVVDLINVGGTNAVGGKLVVTVNKCDPPLAGDYASLGTDVAVDAKDCDNNYRAEKLPFLTNDFWFDFEHDTETDELIITGSRVSDVGPFTLTGNGEKLDNGTLRFTNMTIVGTTIADRNFDLVPN